MALGATPSSIFRIVMRQGIGLAMAGTVAGLALSMAGSKFLRGILFGVGANDVATLIGASLVVLGIAAGACLGPAWRATRIDLIRCLRQE
jgi:ABC-type lipoprotein release transport system permease subunit